MPDDPGDPQHCVFLVMGVSFPAPHHRSALRSVAAAAEKVQRARPAGAGSAARPAAAADPEPDLHVIGPDTRLTPIKNKPMVLYRYLLV